VHCLYLEKGLYLGSLSHRRVTSDSNGLTFGIAMLEPGALANSQTDGGRDQRVRKGKGEEEGEKGKLGQKISTVFFKFVSVAPPLS